MKNLAIFGVPRSGTSWLGQIFNSHPDVVMRFQPLFSFQHKGRLSDQSSAEEVRQFYQEIEQSTDEFVLMQSEFHRNYPVFQKSHKPTHLLFKETRYLNIVENILRQCSEIRIIGLVRDPLSVLASWMNAPKEFSQEWNIEQEWRLAQKKNGGLPEEFYGFEKWKEVAISFFKFKELYPEQFRMARYDKLNASPEETTRELFNFAGLAYHPQVDEFILASRSVHHEDPYSVFKGKKKDSQASITLPLDIQNEVRRELKGTPLQSFLVSDT